MNCTHAVQPLDCRFLLLASIYSPVLHPPHNKINQATDLGEQTNAPNTFSVLPETCTNYYTAHRSEGYSGTPMLTVPPLLLFGFIF
jgi:hypothetical protein